MLERKSMDCFQGETVWDVFCRAFEVKFREESLGPRITEVNGVASEFYHFFLSGGAFKKKGLPFTRTWYGKKRYLDMRHMGASEVLNGLEIDVTLVSSCADLSHSVKKRFDRVFYDFKVDGIKGQMAGFPFGKRDLSASQPENRVQCAGDAGAIQFSQGEGWFLWQMFQRNRLYTQKPWAVKNPEWLGPGAGRREETSAAKGERGAMVMRQANRVVSPGNDFASALVYAEGLTGKMPESCENPKIMREAGPEEVMPVGYSAPVLNMDAPQLVAQPVAQEAKARSRAKEVRVERKSGATTHPQAGAATMSGIVSCRKPVPLSSLKNFKAAIFDLDGVLVDSEKAHMETFQQAFSRFGIEISPSYWRRNYAGIGSRAVVEDLFRKNGIKESAPGMVSRRAGIYQQYIGKNGLPAVPGALKAIGLIRESGTRAIVASSGHRSHISASLRSIGVSGMPFVGHEDVKNQKPSPDTFLLAAEKIGAKPSECVVFEDSLSGIRAAASAGMVCVALSTTLRASQLRGRAAIVVKDFNSPNLGKLLSRMIAKRKKEKGGPQATEKQSLAPAKKRRGKKLRRPVLVRLD